MLALEEVLDEQPICIDIWREKYRYGEEPNYAATCARVVAALTARETEAFRSEALALMRARAIVPAGRILAGAGTDKRVTLINCFVSPDIQDSMRTEADLPGVGIMDALAVASYTQQMGGGIGMDFSSIRPRGALVRRTQSVSSGVLPFMDMWDAMCATIRSSGSRRGAMMATLGIWHPDVEEFVEAKRQPGRLTNFNVSVLVPDSFMHALESDEPWDLWFDVPRADGQHAEVLPRRAEHNRVGSHYIYKRLRARDLWDKIVGSTYVHAEPGVIFIDRVNDFNNLRYCERIHATNPCGEQPLPAGGACNLGHTNLAVMVRRPFSADAEFAFDLLERAARVMVRLLDNVLDVTLWPVPEQAEESRKKRRVGLGFTGLASALQQLGIPYGSPQAIEFARRVALVQAEAAYWESVELARERGSFPLFVRDEFMRSPFVQHLPADLQDAIAQHGTRNGVLLSVAPTGTTSLLIGNVSSGIEPVFAHRYRRLVRDDNGALNREYSVYDYGYLNYCRKNGLDPEQSVDIVQKEKGFVTTEQLTVEQHLAMAAAVQQWTDAAISKTINCPESMSFDDFKQVYTRAHELGLKGCTTYRPDRRSGRGAVLMTEESPGKGVNRNGPKEDTNDKAQAAEEVAAVIAPPLDYKLPMQDVVEGRRYRIKWPSEDCAYYVTITDCLDASGKRRPFELFINTKSERHSEWVKAFSLLVTAIFRREGDPAFVVDELRSVFSATGGAWMRVPWSDRPRLAPSLVAAIGLKIEEHMRWLGLIRDDETLLDRRTATATLMPAQDILDVCESCGARAVAYQEGCSICHACGRSDCG